MHINVQVIMLWVVLLAYSVASVPVRAQDSTDVDSIIEDNQTSETLVKEDSAKKPSVSVLPAPLPKAKTDTTTVEKAAEEVTDNVGDALKTARDLLSPGKLLTILIVLFMVFGIIRLFGYLFDYLSKRLNRYRLRILRLQPIVNVTIWVVAIYSTIVALFDPEPEAVYALVASSALALGFAAQDLLKNIFGGLMIIFDRPFQKGDRILIDNYYGEVEKIGIRVTRIKTLDDSLVTIPNSKIISDSISDANAGVLDCMVVINLWLPVTAPVERIKKIAYEAAITSRFINLDKEIKVLFFEQFDNRPTTNVKIKAYVFDARYEKAFESDVTEAAKKAFAQAGIFSELDENRLPKGQED